MPLHGFHAKDIPSRKISYLVEFDETPRFWYPHVACDAWIDFSSWTVELQPSEYRENLHFFSLSHFSLSLSIRSLPLPPSFFSSLSSISSYPPELPFFFFVCSSHHFLFIFLFLLFLSFFFLSFIFSFISLSLFLHFIFFFSI